MKNTLCHGNNIRNIDSDCYKYWAAGCSGFSDNLTPVAVSQIPAADKLEQTKPDDPKFVGRLKTLNLGASRRCQNSGGFGLPVFSSFCLV